MSTQVQEIDGATVMFRLLAADLDVVALDRRRDGRAWRATVAGDGEAALGRLMRVRGIRVHEQRADGAYTTFEFSFQG